MAGLNRAFFMAQLEKELTWVRALHEKRISDVLTEGANVLVANTNWLTGTTATSWNVTVNTENTSHRALKTFPFQYPTPRKKKVYFHFGDTVYFTNTVPYVLDINKPRPRNVEVVMEGVFSYMNQKIGLIK